MNELEITLWRFSQICFWAFKTTADSILLRHASMNKRLK